jgi:hypothetical protein
MGIDNTVVTAHNVLLTGIPTLIARAVHEMIYANPLIAAHIRTLEKLGVERGRCISPSEFRPPSL